jgi:transposase
MDIVNPRGCGLDVHKKRVVACLLISSGKGEPIKEIRTFSTMTDDLLALADWLIAHGVTHVAMESTGVYWKPIYNLFEGLFTLVVMNPQHVKVIAGKKTDVKDAEWIATLLRHGLVKSSFIPERPQRELRELTRYRVSLVRERAAEANRIQKTLEGANIKLASVASDILGLSGRHMLEALVAGQMTPSEMAQLARGRLKEKIPQLERALVGRFGAHQRFLLARQLAHLDDLEELLAEVGEEIQRRLEELGAPEDTLPPSPGDGEPPVTRITLAGAAVEGAWEAAVKRLQTIPGVGERIAQALVAEIGIDMGRFPTHRHLASWAAMCPGNNESGGKRKSGKTRKGSPWLRSVLVEAAWAACRSKETYLAAQYQRLKMRRGAKKAAMAVGHTILVIAYYIIKDGTTYQELGNTYFDKRDEQAVTRRAVKRLEALGYTVTLERQAA